MYSRILVLLILVSFTFEVYPQYLSSGILLWEVSPRAIGAGGTGTANIKSDPFGYWYNPAYLGHVSNRSFLSAGFYPETMGGSYNTFNTYTFSVGYNLQTQVQWLPVSIGAAYSHINYESNIEGFVDKDNFAYYSLALGFHSIVSLSAGLTVKDLTSEINDNYDTKMNATTIDYGVLLSIPLNNFLNKPLMFDIAGLPVYTDFNYNVGYTIQNVGNKKPFFNKMDGNAPPRSARLAHNLNLGFLYHSEPINIEILNLSYSIDAKDILLEYNDMSFDTKYKGMLGDIKPGRNLFSGKSDKNVEVNKGMEIEFGEMLCFSWGGFDDGWHTHKTSGFIFGLNGLLKLSNLYLHSNFVGQLIDKFNFQYFSSTSYSNEWNETEYKGIALTISGF